MDKRALIAGAAASFGLAVADLALLNLHLVPEALVSESVAAEPADAVASPAPEPAPARVAAVDRDRIAADAPVPPAQEAEADAGAAEAQEAAAAEPAEAREAAAEPTEDAAGRLPDPVVIRFSTGDAELDATARDHLAAIAGRLQADAGLRAHIQGHADERGSLDFNDELADRRAKRVADELMAQGVVAERLVTESFGERRPLVRGEGGDAWEKNRRVEIRFERGRP